MTLLFETTRLLLRPFEDRDIAAFARYRSDPEVARYQGWNTPYTMEQASRFVAGMKAARPGEPGEWFQLALALKPSGDIIGDVAFEILKEDIRQAEVGFTLARPHQGQGYASEAVRRLLAYLFDELGLHRIRANCDTGNSASARLLERVGMRHEGRFMDSLWFKGGWASEDWYAILRREWQAQQPKD